jgi:predicted transcriptional regulator
MRTDAEPPATTESHNAQTRVPPREGMLGDATKKIQKLSTLAEKLYEKVNDLQARAEETTQTVNDTNDRVGELATELEQQRALLEAIADDHGIDVDEHIDDQEASTPSDTDHDETESTTGDTEKPA